MIRIRNGQVDGVGVSLISHKFGVGVHNKLGGGGCTHERHNEYVILYASVYTSLHSICTRLYDVIYETEILICHERL